jgi:hypothetical protein
VEQAGVGILSEHSGIVVKANPSWSHHICVDVVQQVVDGQIFHPQVESFVQLLPNQPEVFRQEKHSLPGS